jgi:hypothetical protein
MPGKALFISAIRLAWLGVLSYCSPAFFLAAAWWLASLLL